MTVKMFQKLLSRDKQRDEKEVWKYFKKVSPASHKELKESLRLLGAHAPTFYSAFVDEARKIKERRT